MPATLAARLNSRLRRIVDYERLAARTILGLARPPVAFRDDVSVHMLITEPAVSMGLVALRSFQVNAGFRCPVFFHDDGSVDSTSALLGAGPTGEVQVISRADSDRLLAEKLGSQPACAAALARHLFLRKFFAPLFLAPADKYMLLDSDIAFFARPDEIIAWADDPKPAIWFNADCQDAYAVSRDAIEREFGRTLWSRVNAGLALLDRRLLDLELAERFLAFVLGQPHKIFWIEQTLYAFLASAAGRGGLLPSTYQVSYGEPLVPGAVGRHYIDNLKPGLFYRQGVGRFLAHEFGIV